MFVFHLDFLLDSFNLICFILDLLHLNPHPCSNMGLELVLACGGVSNGVEAAIYWSYDRAQPEWLQKVKVGIDSLLLAPCSLLLAPCSLLLASNDFFCALILCSKLLAP